MKNRFIRYEFEIFFSIRFNMIGIKIEFIYLKRESYHKTFFEKFEIVQRYLIIIKELIRILK